MLLRRIFEHFLFALGGFASNIAFTTVTPVLPLEIERRALLPFLLLWSHILVSSLDYSAP